MNVDVNDGLTNGTPCIIKKNLITEFMHLQDLALFGFSLPVQILVKNTECNFLICITVKHIRYELLFLKLQNNSNTVMTIPSKLLGARF